MEKNDDCILVRLPSKLKKSAYKIADRDGRSLPGLVRKLLNEAIKKEKEN